MNKWIQTSILCFTIFVSIHADADSIPEISCRQGTIIADYVKSASDKQYQDNMVKDYLRTVDQNIFIERNAADWETIQRDQFQIKNVQLEPFSQVTFPQKVSDNFESKLVFDRDPEDDNCFLIQQKTLQKAILTHIKKQRHRKHQDDPSVVQRACFSKVTQGETIFLDHEKVSTGKGQTAQIYYPYAICAVNNDYSF